MNAIETKKISFFDKLILLAVWFAACARLTFPGINNIALYVVVPILLFISLKDYKKIFQNKYIKTYSLLMLWMLGTCTIAYNQSYAYSQWFTMLGGWMCGIIMYSLAVYRPHLGIGLFFTYILLFGTTILYLYTSGDILYLDVADARISDSRVNANDIAYLLFFVISLVSVFLVKIRARKLYVLVIFVLLTSLLIWCAFITASRQILIVILPLGFVGFRITYNKQGFNRKTIISTIITIGVLYSIYYFYLSDAIENSYLGTRLQEDATEDSRVELLRDAVALGLENPLLGVGNANYVFYSQSGNFSHCSYTEMLANCGIPAFAMYLYLVIMFIYDQRKNFFFLKSLVFYMLFLIGIFWAIYNIFYAFFTGPWLIAFFFLLIGYSEAEVNSLSKSNSQII